MINNDKQFKNNQQGMNALCQGVDYLVNQKLGSAPYDRTFFGYIKAVDYEYNTYTVVLDGNEYSDIPATGKFDVNATCLIMCPQNQFNQMFIYGVIDTNDYTS